MLRTFLITTFLIFGNLYSVEISKDNIYFKIYEAAKQIQEKNNQGVKTLYQLSLEDHKDAMLNKLLIHSTTLAMINLNSNTIVPYIASVDNKFMELNALGFLDHPPYKVQCFKCVGTGFVKSPCKSCYKGVCKNCKGKKAIAYEGLLGKVEIRNCIPCEATGTCKNCDLSGIAQKSCHICYEKGTVFNAQPVPTEYDKSIKFLLDFIPKYAASKKIYITAELAAIATQDKIREELEKAKEMADKRLEAERIAAKAEEQAAQERKAAKDNLVKNKKIILNNPSNIEYALMEFNQFFKARERIQKVSVYETAEAKYVDNKAVLTVFITNTVANAQLTLKEQYFDAFYAYYKMRCQVNGVRNPVIEVMYNKKLVAIVENGSITHK